MDYEGNTIDEFLGEENPEDENILTRKSMEKKFLLRNRAILSNGKNCLAEIPKLSCIGCFKKEYKAGLLEDNFLDNFKRFQGRLKLEKVGKTHHRNSNSGVEENGVNLIFKKCGWCNISITFAFEDFDLGKEQYKILVEKANKYSGEDLCGALEDLYLKESKNDKIQEKSKG